MKKKTHSNVEPLTGGSGGAHALRSASVVVLHIDDDPNDTELFRAAVRKAQADFQLQNVHDGEQAIAYLSGSGAFADRARYGRPALILLDLKMPRASGFEVLRWIRARPDLLDVPVIVLSGSELQEDVRRAYALGANSYLVKPSGFEALLELVKTISLAWLPGGRPAPVFPGLPAPRVGHGIGADGAERSGWWLAS